MSCSFIKSLNIEHGVVTPPLFGSLMHYAVPFHLFTMYFYALFTDKTVKLWKVSEREKQAMGYNLRDENGDMIEFEDSHLVVPHYEPMELMIEASPKKVFANAHMYHINSISVNSDDETYLSADDLRINLWHLEITDRSFS